MADTVEARVTHNSPAKAEQLYDAWLNPRQIRQWMAASLQQSGLAGEMIACGTDPVVGGAFLFSDRRDGVEARHWGHYRQLERPKKLVFTWITSEAEANDPSKVTILIEPAAEGTGTVVTLSHEMLAKWEQYRDRTERSWQRMLEQIDIVLAGP
ncbi:MAG TPA: SRPBCC family protein [Devosia sp.]|nr:SRPBCC family protein [Devosia sp.]